MVHAWVTSLNFIFFVMVFLVRLCMCVSGGWGLKMLIVRFKQTNSGKWLFSAKTNKSEQGGGKSKIDCVF